MRGLITRAGTLAAAILLVAAGGASAATLEVTRTSDPVPDACTASDCSVREAVLRANATPVADRIVLKDKTYRLTRAGEDSEALTGDLDITGGSGRLTVTGAGAQRTSIVGDSGDRLFHLQDAALAVLQRVSLTGGEGAIGGAILTEGDGGSLNLSRVTIRGGAGSTGAGIYLNNDSLLRVTRSQFIGNEASFSGGGLYANNDSRATLVRTVFRRNSGAQFGGGAIYNQNEAILTVRKSTFERNRAPGPNGRGGAIYNQNEATARIFDSTISRNTAGNAGGGIHAQNLSTLRAVNTTISGNTANEGGAINLFDQAKVELAFTTVADNRALSGGGAIFEAADPPGPPAPPYVTLKATLVAANTAPMEDNCVVSAAGNWQSDGSNVEDRASCQFTKGSDRPNAKAGLRKLARNGGPTKTHALKPSSDAVNAAKRKGCPKRDQRGVKRPQGRRCDSGSYELKQR